jgi:hypothetical protein
MNDLSWDIRHRVAFLRRNPLLSLLLFHPPPPPPLPPAVHFLLAPFIRS